MTTWYKEILCTMAKHGETFDDMENCTLTDEEWHRQFNPGWGGTEGVPFTLWTKNRVYFPAQYDGSEWVASVPRNPNSEKVSHIGGG